MLPDMAGSGLRTESVQKTRKLFYGWWMVLSAAILNIFSGASFYYGFTVFFNPIRESFHWTAAQTSIAFTFQRLESGLLGPVAGFFVDRVSPRILMVGGWTVVGLGFILLSYINSLWSFYGIFVLLSIGLSFGSFVVANTAIARWFDKKRSRALAFIYVGYGFSGSLVPLLALAIKTYTWRPTLLWMGIIMLVLGVPLSLLIRDRPQDYGYLPDGADPSSLTDTTAVSTPAKPAVKSTPAAQGYTVREALKMPAFWFVGFAFLFQQLGTSAVMVHVAPYLESVGFSRTIASLAVTGVTLCSLIGRLGFGWLGDFVAKRYLIAASLALQAVGLFVFAFVRADMVWMLILFFLTYAPGYGGPIPLRPALQADYFGTKSLGTLMGLMSTVSMVGGLLSPVFAGRVYDVTGSYHNAWMIIAAATLPSVVLILLAKPPRPATH